MIKRVTGDGRDSKHPVLTMEDETAISNRKKANIIARVFAKLYTLEKDRMRDRTLNQHSGMLNRKEEIIQ